MTKLNIVHAILALHPTAQFTTNDGKIEEWHSPQITQPTEQEIEVKLTELKYQEEVNAYQEKRKSEYPDWGDQLDKIYHSGIDAWKVDIKKIKDKYPKQTMDTTELQKRQDAAIFKVQKKNYEKAVARLAQHELSSGVVDPISGMHIIEPLPLVVKNENGNDIRNPLVVQDEAEREAAQKVINKTPQAVIDSINT